MDMRYHEIFGESSSGRAFLAEMPGLTDPMDFGMGDENKRLHQTRMLLSLTPQIKLEDTPDHELVRAGSGSVVYFYMLEKPHGRLVYFVKCEVVTVSFIGPIVSQVALWRDDTSAAVQDVTKRVFNSMLLKQWPTVMSDEEQTDNGRTFWIRRMAEAAKSGLRVGLADMRAKTVDWRSSEQPYSEWIDARRNAWAKGDLYHLRSVISRA